MRHLEKEEQEPMNEMPHELVMDLHNIDFHDLSASIQADVRQLDRIYDAAMSDGVIDQEEENELIAKSYKIAVRIKNEHLNITDERSGSGGAIGGVLAGIGIAALAVFGFSQIKQQ